MRKVFDLFGELEIPEGAKWGAATARSLQNFSAGAERVPLPVIYALAEIKLAAAQANAELGAMAKEKAEAIKNAAERILSGEFDGQFPLSVWQTGSGTQSNMNVNEVIVGLALEAGVQLHPNDDVNMGQSTNDAFPSALHMAAAEEVHKLLEEVSLLVDALMALKLRYGQLLKLGRTHLQDAVPMTLGQELSGWAAALAADRENILATLPGLYGLALGATAVGTGLNAEPGMAKRAIAILAQRRGLPFLPAENYFAGLNSRSAMAFCHGALKTLATDLYRIANDIRLLASGPRGGFGELILPANEPGSSIMPGKVNPTQCEAVCMACIQVMGNDAAVGVAASQGQLELNANLPLLALDFLQSASLLCGVIKGFRERCILGMVPNEARMAQNLNGSLMLVTALSPRIGYDKAARIAKAALDGGTTLRTAAISLGFMTGEEFDAAVQPKNMV